jgi:hypothetical protein
MAIRQLKDGRWVCYYRLDGKVKFEYFERGKEGEAKAWARYNEINPQKGWPLRPQFGLLFIDLVKEYLSHKVLRELSEASYLVRSFLLNNNAYSPILFTLKNSN